MNIEMKLVFGSLLLVFCLGVDGHRFDFWTKNRFENVVVLKHFWKSTGLSPAGDRKSRASFLLSEDEKLNIDFIGALPNQAIKMIRIHWLLDLITVVSDPRSGKPKFNLEDLDRIIDRLHRNGLSPSFELMGNPSDFFHDFNKQSKHWMNLIKKIINRYSDLYGADYLHGWRFELMNEPDLKQYNFFNFTLEEYIDYFRVSEEAVPSLAGPAGLFRENKEAHPLCWGFLDFCNLNPCNLNMITFHRKGGGAGSEVVSGGLDLINEIILKYPRLKGVPFGNDEGDVLKGWHKPEEWRADVRYAALVVQVIIGHIEEMFVKRNVPFELLSNDNAFLSFSPNYFTQRTLLARFQMNNTTPKHIQFFRKPVYSVMGMLSLLGNYLKDVRYRPGERGFSYLVTSYKYQDTYLGVITNDRVSNESYNETYADVNFKIGLGNLTLSGVAVGYVMDNAVSNPYRVWRHGGRPDFPDPGLRRMMREAEGFERLFIRKLSPHKTALKFELKAVLIPSIFVVNICYEETEEPGPVTDLRYVNVTSNEILLFWKDDFVDSRFLLARIPPVNHQPQDSTGNVSVGSSCSRWWFTVLAEYFRKIAYGMNQPRFLIFNRRCLLTYIVEHRKLGETTFRRVNEKDSIFLSYHHDAFADVAGEYRVAAVDYWNRHGPFSNALTVHR